MDETIIALLNHNLRVIIPDFGAFIIRQKQPRIIVFNEFLRYNDGILIDFIVKNEGIDREIAEQRILNFAEDGTKLLASGREMVIAGLGSLRKDSSGKINFMEAPEIIEIEKTTPAEPEIIAEVAEKQDLPKAVELKIKKKPGSKNTAGSKNKAKSSVKKSTRTAKPSAKKIAADVPSEVIQQANTEPHEENVPIPVTQHEVIDAEVYEPQAAIESRDTMDPRSAGTVEVSPVEIDSAETEGPGHIEPLSTEFAKVMETEVSKPPRNAESDTISGRHVTVSTNRILTWALIILFLNAGILAWFIFRNKTRGNAEVKSATTMISDTLYDQLADSVRAAAMDTGIVYSEVPDEADYNNKGMRTPDSRYYIVAGCFRDEVNADSLVSSLKLLGYNAEKFGKIGNLFAVCYASFDNKEDAVPELKKIREKIPSAWMTRF